MADIPIGLVFGLQSHPDAFPIDRKYYLFNNSAVCTIPCLTDQTNPAPPQIQQVNYTMLLTQITYTVLYKHSALLSHCLCFCIIPPNVCKCYKDYFPLRPIYSHILPLAVYCGGQDQYYIRSS